MLAIGDKAPLFSAPDQDNKEISLQDFVGKWLVLYFYPKDDTPGCTTEACTIRDNFPALQKLAQVVGVSADSVTSHKQFAQKYHLPFSLLADPEKNIITEYGAKGAIFNKRMTFIIDPKGIIAKIYPEVNPTQHAEEIIRDLQTLTK